MPAGSVLGKKVVTVNGAGEIDFGDIEFKAVGKYTYKVVELDTGLANYTYDKTEYTVVVDVTADANNQLVANYEIKKGTETVNDLSLTTSTKCQRHLHHLQRVRLLIMLRSTNHQRLAIAQKT